MKQRTTRFSIVALIMVTLVCLYAYRNHWSEPAMARKAGHAFLVAAVQGDLARAESLLAVDAPYTASDAVQMYRHFTSVGKPNVIHAPPNRSGVKYVVTGTGVTSRGFAETTLLLLRKDQGSWVVVGFGSDLSY